MVGCFGLRSDPHQAHFPVHLLVENRARIDAFQLNKSGAFMEGAVTELRCGDRGNQLARQGAEIWINATPITVTWTDWSVPWFACPGCGRRCRYLYLGELACQKCLHLDHSSRHLHRSVPGLWKIRQLRRQIGVDERPFSPLPRRQRHHLRYHRIVAEITALERGLVEHLGSINRNLSRRIRIRKAKGKW